MSKAGKIHIVDDDESIRHSLTLMMEGAGRQVVTHASGGAFFAAFDPADAACIVLDVRLPDMDGLDILQRLHAAGAPPCPVLIITGHGDVPLAVKAMKSGAADFVEKPFNGDTILARIEAALAATAPVAVDDRRGGEAAARLRELTPREREVLDQLVVGQPNKIIAYELGISPRTVENHRARVMEKMHARSLSHLVRMAMAAGIDPDAL